ncbi:HAMP domain-containing protein [Duganella sp. LX20W]|uniref:histidine kinase n=1 Tax=Rugamonas brunnea TaxID=2758569 RepID=A0A7W2ETZ3_9BURK|nr:ATP-binding protein [Rugamonas brunnea]MBA5638515.1 HAMP domain-containing protein [Rugamonas brunnea]
MGRLFWKFFLSILLAQLAATVGIGGAVWLKNRNAAANAGTALDTSPPAEMAINSAAATLEFGGAGALRGLLAAMRHHRVFAVDAQGRELLGRTVSPAMLAEARALLKEDDARPAVRDAHDGGGRHYLLFLPSHERLRGFDGGYPNPLLAGLGDPRMGEPRLGEPPRHGPGDGPGGPPPMPRGDDARPAPDGATPRMPPPGTIGTTPHMPPGAIGAGGPPRAGPPPDGHNPRFQPLAPYVPIVAAILASLLFAMLLAWYFSRPIRALRAAFEAAAGGDLAPRFVDASGKRGTELNDLGRDFDRMTARLRSLIDGQTRLLHDVSHELRSPLARLQAAIGLAHQQPDKMASSMARIERESVRMDKLVGELLTLSRLEAGALGAGQEEISMADLLQQIVDDAGFEASSHGRSVACDGEADVVVTGQADLLARAIENVVRNAIKHSPEGGTVELQLRPRPHARQLCVRVLDNGPGVAVEELASIFLPFFRSANTRNDTEGHGLGLAIAQHVVHAHGGAITASNRPEGGLCVEIVLPMVQQRASGMDGAA